MADHGQSVLNKLDARLILSLHRARAGRAAAEPLSASVFFTGDLSRCGDVASRRPVSCTIPSAA